MKDQIQFETNGLTVLAVKVPEHSFQYFLASDSSGVSLMWPLSAASAEYEGDSGQIDLPEGNWKIHAVTDSMTEEQAKVLVSEQFYHYEKWVLLVKSPE